MLCRKARVEQCLHVAFCNGTQLACSMHTRHEV